MALSYPGYRQTPPTVAKKSTQEGNHPAGGESPGGESPRRGITTQGELLGQIEQTIGFVASPVLKKLVERIDEAPAFTDLLWKISFPLSLGVGKACWNDADPCLLDLADLEDGNYYCLYFYPPLLGQVPIVEFVHDDSPQVQWRGGSFDEFFASHLAEYAEHDRDAVAQVLDDLGLLASWPKPLQSAPPDRFSLAHNENAPTVADAEQARADGDLSKAERLYVGSLEALSGRTREGGASGVAEKLREIYSELAWKFHIQATERIGG